MDFFIRECTSAGRNALRERRTPRVCAGVIIENPNGEILLLRSHKFSNLWIVPGGGVEWGERMAECAKREVKEETGLNIADVAFLDADEEIFPKEFYKKEHFIFLDFTAKTTETAVTLNDEAEEYRWVAPREALKMKVNPSTTRFIQKYIDHIKKDPRYDRWFDAIFKRKYPQARTGILPARLRIMGVKQSVT